MLFTSLSQLKTSLTTNDVELGEVEIKCNIFRCDALFPLLFITALIPQTLTWNNTACRYQLSKETSPINHLLLMDDLEQELHSLVNIVRIISNDAGMKFGMDKCRKLHICKEKLIYIDDVERPDGEHRDKVGEDGCKDLCGF